MKKGENMKKNSKQLDSILSSHMHATPIQVANVPEEEPEKILVPQEREVRLTAEVPESIKRQLKQKMAETFGETERSIILRALKAYGFEIDENQIKDKRNRH